MELKGEGWFKKIFHVFRIHFSFFTPLSLNKSKSVPVLKYHFMKAFSLSEHHPMKGYQGVEV
jgi:hypothetical protein